MSTDVARLVKEASEAVKDLPEHLQEAAFNRAYETLLGATKNDAAAGKGKKPTRTKSQAGKSPGKTSAKKTTSGDTAPRKNAAGPAGQMAYLLETDFFDTARTIRDIIDTVKDERGRTLKPNEVSPVLLRWLRGNKLSRKKNDEGQYEYIST